MKRKYLIPLNLQLFADDPDPTPDPSPAKTFSQDELDKIVADRIARERKKYGDYDDVKAQLAAFEKEREEAEKAKLTEIERAQKEREDALTKAADYEKQVAELAKARENDILEHAIQLAAKDTVDPDAVALMIDRSTLRVEGGKAVGVVEAVEALKAAKPYLAVKQDTQPRSIGDTSVPPKQKDKTAEQILAELAEKARKSGRSEDKVAYAEAKAKFQK